MVPTDEKQARVAGAPAAAEAPATGCYVYGILAASATDPAVEKLTPVGGDKETRVGYVRHGDVAAAVSPLPGGRPLGRPEDLRAHADVLNTLAATGAPVLPFRFGTVLKDTQAVSDDVLAKGHDSFVHALERLDGRAQFTLRATYDEEALLREIFADRPDITELRESVAQMPEDAAYYQRVRLGELIYESVAARREKDTELIKERLGPLADAMVVSEAPTDDGVTDVAFLVNDDRRADFERTADRLAGDWQNRIRMRLLGPLAPYDFVAEAMEETEGEA
ncbi:GvpL/GvpF family gas vesicle protein [Actinacidiphila acidipaludis]|uniref:GvpL/GvpF family gas vesicle protein n=1 Tax=Actinacidiphila acidipaludis TaxID=2873382 RepID=A0ABS7QKB1_9ACTN|nr:GvpL/GvpF family gas vesicle protein [Streptomyces acidipaludis]MBY8882224.1 GvpL/GvpF family gas vesicle protein [Streptomyces acidipaludis]